VEEDGAIGVSDDGILGEGEGGGVVGDGDGEWRVLDGVDGEVDDEDDGGYTALDLFWFMDFFSDFFWVFFLLFFSGFFFLI
jgi:hypothetical protein